MRHHALQMYDYHLWANQRIFKHLEELPQEVYSQEIKSGSSVSNMLLHIYQTDTLWLSVMKGENFDKIMALVNQLSEETKAKNIEEMEMKFSGISQRYKVFLDSQEDLDKVVSCEHPHFGRLETQLYQLVQHVVNHGTYHRGNITTMLRELGHPSVSMDYIVYLYEMDKK